MDGHLKHADSNSHDSASDAGSVHDSFSLRRRVGGILLTGGASRRMGFDKASILIGGIPSAIRIAATMQAVVSDAVEVGPGVSGLPAISEEPTGSGPLFAVCAGAKALSAIGAPRPAIVLACDLPLVSETLLRTLAYWPGGHSVVPIIGGRAQPLCARWSAEDLATAAELVEVGRRSMRSLVELPGVELVEEARWPGDVDRREFFDIDTPADLKEIGLSWEIPSRVGGRDDGSGAPGPSVR